MPFKITDIEQFKLDYEQAGCRILAKKYNVSATTILDTARRIGVLKPERKFVRSFPAKASKRRCTRRLDFTILTKRLCFDREIGLCQYCKVPIDRWNAPDACYHHVVMKDTALRLQWIPEQIRDLSNCSLYHFNCHFNPDIFPSLHEGRVFSWEGSSKEDIGPRCKFCGGKVNSRASYCNACARGLLRENPPNLPELLGIKPMAVGRLRARLKEACPVCLEIFNYKYRTKEGKFTCKCLRETIIEAYLDEGLTMVSILAQYKVAQSVLYRILREAQIPFRGVRTKEFYDAKILAAFHPLDDVDQLLAKLGKPITKTFQKRCRADLKRLGLR